MNSSKNIEPRVLMLLKKNEIYSFKQTTRRSSGLYNSTQFIVRALQTARINAKIVECVDNNDIDREVHKYKPTHVVIQALWVVPEKFDVLKKLHPSVKWFCHLHSNMPFLALEGIAMDWIIKYQERGLHMIANSHASWKALSVILSPHDLTYLPNVYLSKPLSPQLCRSTAKEIHIGCFGAVRPLKNHLLQALAAIKFAESKGMALFFYINGTRVETGGEPVLKNLKQLFEHLPKHTLVQIRWCEPEDFIHILHNEIDIGMQVSLTETFSVVTADYVTAGIPIVVSKEVTWADEANKALDDSVDSIVNVMDKVWQNKSLVKKNQNHLLDHAAKATTKWANFFTRKDV